MSNLPARQFDENERGVDYLRETREMAARFLRRHRIMTLWHLQITLEVLIMTNGNAVSLPHHGKHLVVPQLPATLPVPKDEVAILRAFLAHEIDQILFGRT